jgi:hypothetical protein
MGEAFYGRARAYDEALGDDAAEDALPQALMRNLGLDPAETGRFARYVRSVEDTLKRHTDEQLLQGEVSWPRLP